MMRDFRIALVQQECYVRRKARNLAGALARCRKAADAGAELVCLPELNVTGHAGSGEMVAQAEPVPDGPSVRAFCEAAGELKVTIAAGIAEVDRGAIYNTHFLVGPEGYLGRQRKVHLSKDEYFHFRGGTALPVFDLPMARVGVVICYDNHVPEVQRCLAVHGAEVILAPHAGRFGKWPKNADGRRAAVRKTKDNWRLVHRCRAFDNGTYQAVCNMVGRSATGIRGVQANHTGGCMVVDPRGDVIAESRSRDIREEMLVVDLKAKAAGDVVSNLRTRKPEVFRSLCEPTE